MPRQAFKGGKSERNRPLQTASGGGRKPLPKSLLFDSSSRVKKMDNDIILKQISYIS